MTIKTLVVDDTREICNLVALMAKKYEHDVLIETDSLAFEASYLQHKPDIIFLDLQMPGMDGIEILRVLADHSSNAAITIMSGVGGGVLNTTMELGRSMGLNIAGVLNKPLDLEKLREILTKTINDRAGGFDQVRELSEKDIAQAIEDNRLQIHYQPKIEINSGRVTGVEALVRMVAEDSEMIMPDRFISIAEETGLITSLTYKVIETTLQDIATLRENSFGNMTISVNISPYLLSNLNLPDKLVEIVLSCGADPSQYILEITESAAIGNSTNTFDVLSRLRLKGFQLSIDDFGTGYSTYQNLLQQLFSELKIDKSFVLNAEQEENSATIVKSVVELARKFDINVVAEGIENEASLRWLASINCTTGQGYHICRPLPALQFKSWLQQYNDSHELKVSA